MVLLAPPRREGLEGEEGLVVAEAEGGGVLGLFLAPGRVT